MLQQLFTRVSLLAALLVIASVHSPATKLYAQAESSVQTAPAGAAAAEGDQAQAPDYRVLQDRPDRLLVELPNRMLVIAQELHHAPVVSAQVWIRTGSIYEQEHVGAGLSHFLEHLISGGTTTTRSEEESVAILGRIGARTNAATGLDNVRYYIDTTAEHAPLAIELLTDWMRNSVITQTEYDRERDVIQKEFSSGRGDVGRILWKLTQQARYRTHPARHPTIGYLDEFLAVSRQEIFDFYKRMYVPNNMIFAVAGDIDRHAVVEQIASLWSDAKAQPTPQVSLPIELPDAGGEGGAGQREAVSHAPIANPRLRLAWPGTRLAAPGDYALDLLGVVLGQGEASRLPRTVRDEQRRVTSIHAYNLSFPWGEGFFGIDAEVFVPPPGADPENPQGLPGRAVELAQQAILEQVERLRREGVTKDELARAQRQTLARVIYQTQTASDVADRLASDLIGKADPDYLAHYAQAVQGLTRGSLAAAADRFLEPQRRIAITLLPQAPGKEPEELTRPEDPPLAQAMEAEQVALDNIVVIDELRRRLREQQAQEIEPIVAEAPEYFELPNGLRVIIIRSTLIPAVAMQLYQIGGLLTDPPDQPGLANATAEMQMRGTATRSAQDIAQQIESLGASLNTACGHNSFYARAMSLREDWPSVLELLADVTLNPTFPQDEWQKLQPRLLASIDRQNDSWHGELRRNFLGAYFGPAHPWGHIVPGTRQSVAQLGASDLQAFHRRHLGASSAVLAIVGDVEVDAALQAATRLFSAMPETPEVMFEAPLPQAPQATTLQVETAKQLAAVQIGFGPGVTRASPDYPPLQVLASVLSSFPSGWLEQELRGRGPGLAYAVGAYAQAGLVPGYFSVIFNTEPANVPEAVSRAMATIDRARAVQVDEATLERAKASVLTDELFAKQSLSDLAMEAALNELYDLPQDETERFVRQVKQLDPQLLQVLAQTYLRQPVTVVLTHDPVPDDVLKSAAEAQFTPDADDADDADETNDATDEDDVEPRE